MKLPMRRCHHIAFVSLLFLLPYSVGRAQDTKVPSAQTYVLEGSTTFAHSVMEPHQGAIEASSGHKLTVVPNKSSQGIIALFEKFGDFAMISGPLQNEINALKPNYPDLPFDRLQTFNIANTRMAFAINRDNPVHATTDDKMRRILMGEITNWRDIGGPDLPIRIVIVQEGGGVQASIESDLLGGKTISAPNLMSVQGSALGHPHDGSNARSIGPIAAQYRGEVSRNRAENGTPDRTTSRPRNLGRSDRRNAQSHRRRSTNHE